MERVLPCTRMPTATILGLMRVLSDASTAVFRRRLEQLAEQMAAAAALLPKGVDKQRPESKAAVAQAELLHDAGEAVDFDGRAALERLGEHVTIALKHLREGASSMGPATSWSKRATVQHRHGVL